METQSSQTAPPPSATAEQVLTIMMDRMEELVNQVNLLNTKVNTLENHQPSLSPLQDLPPLSSSPQQPLAEMPPPPTQPPAVVPANSDINHHSKDPKIAAPQPFSGKRDETESFLNSCHLYLNARPSEFRDDNARIYWVLSYMQTGSARVWRDYVISHFRKGTLEFRNAHEFLDEIDRKFGDPDKRTTQSLHIRTMMQGDKPADEHVQDFEKAALEAGYTGYPLVVEFKRSLNAGLRKRLTELRPMPVTIDQWYQEAITMDRQWRVAKAEEAFYNRTNQAARKPQQQQLGQYGQGSSAQSARPQFRSNAPAFPARQAVAPPVAPKDPNAMDVDTDLNRGQRGQQKRPPMKCFKCNGLGHFARDCRSQLNVRTMTYDEMREHFEQAEAARKDREVIRAKEDFPDATQ
jgi:hypothetical protein